MKFKATIVIYVDTDEYQNVDVSTYKAKKDLVLAMYHEETDWPTDKDPEITIKDLVD